MNPTNVRLAIEISMSEQRPVFLWGSPGVGKSEIFRQIAAGNNKDLIDLRLSLLDSVDLRGIPAIIEGLTRWMRPSFLPTDGEGILFLDEMNLASQSVLSAAYQLILDRKLGDYTLPENWYIAAAGNRETDGMNISHMPKALASRFRHLELEPDIESWVTWGIENGISVETLAFVRFRPDLLNRFNPKDKERAFPNPRSWEYTDRLCQRTVPAQLLHEMLAGTIGESAAAEYMGFRKIFRSLPDRDAVIADPMNAEVPTDPAVLFALSGSIAHVANNNNMDRICQYADRLPPEFSVLMIRDSVRNDPQTTKTKGYIAWASRNKDILL